MSTATTIRAQDIFVYSMKSTRWLIDSMCKDLTPTEMLHRPCSEANCTAWILGHLITIDHRMLSSLIPSDTPPLPDGFKERFSQKGDAPRASDFGDVSALLPQFLAMRDRLIAATENLDPSTLADPVPNPNARFSNRWQFLSLAGFHTGLHAGHISTIRRTLGKPALF